MTPEEEQINTDFDRLADAAPDLLDALEYLVIEYELLAAFEFLKPGDPDVVLAQARAAIAKAKGEGER